MVQELAYDNCAMFPSRQGSFNMPLGFGYGPQQGQYAQEYCQFNVTEPVPLQQAGSPCAWPAMYAAGSPAGGRAGSAGLDEWSNFCVATSQVAGNGTQSPPSTYQSYRGNAYAALPAEYNSPGFQHMNTSMGGLSNSPSPTPGAGQGYPGILSNSTPTPRQARPPYDWMKKQQLPVIPTTGKDAFLLS